ncbi:MAG: diacylglycerol kinase catalytic region [Frankiales bacterium]|nr:diacylglycerol kinase catalytic region [Frankiales bacterium]
MRLQLVVNPAAGGGRSTKLLPTVRSALTGADLKVTPTSSLEHADELVAEAVADDRTVVAMGGDGIVGRVAGAVAGTGGVMGVIPGGRGNDFCRAAGIPLDIPAACELLRTGTPQPIDLGYAGGHAFIGIASIGFDSEVQERVLTSRLPIGNLIYTYGSLLTIASWKHAEFTCTVDGAPLNLRGWAVAVSNSGRYGGGMLLAPDASLRDGLLDVVTTSETSRIRFLRALPKVFTGRHIEEAAFSVRTASVVHLNADRPFRVFADGDPIASLPCEITVKPAAVQVILPPP